MSVRRAAAGGVKTACGMLFPPLAAACFCLCLAAQYPGSGPPFPLPLPRGGGQSRPTPGKLEPQPFNGVVRARAADSLSIEAEDTRLVEFRCSKQTIWVRGAETIPSSTVKPGDEVTVEARQDDEGFFHALKVVLRRQAAAPSPPAADQPPAPAREPARTVFTPPPPPPDRDDPGPPTLHRGRPAPRAGAAAVEEQPDLPPPAAAGPSKEEALLDQVRQTALEFSETLPNYLCKQVTTRYQSEDRPANWRPLDVVTAAVVYEDGRESYHDIRINDRPTKKPMDDIPGSRSRGEFGTTLRDLFSPSTAAAFRYRGESTAAGLPASVFNFRVERPRSHWETRVGGQAIFPAYKGSVWVDRKTFRVLRIEMQALNIPEEFPADAVEWVVDYEYVRIGPGRYLLPVHAENLACFRGALRCTRNIIDFRNYRKFTSESQIMTIDSTISYEGEAEPAAEKKKP